MAFRRARRCATLSLLLLSCQASAQSRFIVQPKQPQARAQGQLGANPQSSSPAESYVSGVQANYPQGNAADSFVHQSPFGGQEIEWVKRGTASSQDEPRNEARVASATLRPRSTSTPKKTLASVRQRPKGRVLQGHQTARPEVSFNSGIPTVAQRAQKPNMPNAVAKSANSARNVGQQSDNSRHQIAKTVSSRIIASHPRPAEGAQPLAPLQRSIGWQALGERLSVGITQCNHLLTRNAFFSARQQAEESIVDLVRALDKAENRFHCEPAFLAAKQAMREAEDFAAQQRITTDKDMLRRIVDSHQTPILKRQNLENVAPLVAAEHYRLYALQSLLEAAQGHPWASEVYYLIGRTFHAQADNNDGVPELLRQRATIYYQAASSIQPENALATNQLGYMLLQNGQPAEAKDALVASVSAGATPESLANLAEASRRLGDTQMLQWATTNYNAMNPPSSGPQIPEVVEVDPRRFASMSPQAAGPQPITR